MSVRSKTTTDRAEQPPVKPTRSYLVCATPRSGSTLLCEGLESTGVAGRPREYFEEGLQPEVEDFEVLPHVAGVGGAGQGH